LERKIIKTSDGSNTIHIPEWDEQYHSIHGAIQESEHVFIKNGLRPIFEKFPNKQIQILEMGFGTGLNALITSIESKKLEKPISYTTIEAFPVSMDIIEKLNYSELLAVSNSELIELHRSKWEVKNELSDHFKLTKVKALFEEVTFQDEFHLIYFDAFGARVQPELWTALIFKKMFDALKTKGVLVTYSAKGSVRRAMMEVGFIVERLTGPPGKREMLRATKP
jgi:tRNA U34 5-methylaminomethyl-2-thiouridine-forming methyltransferase MnmC